MLGKFFIVVTMFTAFHQFGTDMFIFHQPSDTKQECLNRLNENPDKYMWAAFKNFQGRLKPDKAYCVTGELVKEILDGNISNEGT